MALEDQLNQGWRDLLAGEIKKPYWKALDAYVAKEREANPGKIYPVEEDVFAAYNFMPYEQVRVVLIGQDPYHGPDQAHGLSFSVLPGIDVPPSLRNMYKELESDLGHKAVKHGYLKSWAEQGVMLLNTVLTVRHKEANSHRQQGWEKFTTATINLLNAREQPLVFILWGGPAKKLGAKIDRSSAHEVDDRTLGSVVGPHVRVATDARRRSGHHDSTAATGTHLRNDGTNT